MAVGGDECLPASWLRTLPQRCPLLEELEWVPISGDGADAAREALPHLHHLRVLHAGRGSPAGMTGDVEETWHFLRALPPSLAVLRLRLPRLAFGTTRTPSSHQQRARDPPFTAASDSPLDNLSYLRSLHVDILPQSSVFHDQRRTLLAALLPQLPALETLRLTARSSFGQGLAGGPLELCNATVRHVALEEVAASCVRFTDIARNTPALETVDVDLAWGAVLPPGLANAPHLCTRISVGAFVPESFFRNATNLREVRMLADGETALQARPCFAHLTSLFLSLAGEMKAVADVIALFESMPNVRRLRLDAGLDADIELLMDALRSPAILAHTQHIESFALQSPRRRFRSGRFVPRSQFLIAATAAMPSLRCFEFAMCTLDPPEDADVFDVPDPWPAQLTTLRCWHRCVDATAHPQLLRMGVVDLKAWFPENWRLSHARRR
uniref:Uncharacterized protein n=1 Tax=Neobodo designis TaxID=312471 RepID=A0A7S1VZY8_NEODS